MFNKHIAAAIAIMAATLSTYGSITTIQDLGSSWIGTPTITTGDSPTAFTVAEQNYGSSAPYALSQSFQVSSPGILNNVQLYVGGSFASNSVYLYDLGTGANPTSYTPGSGSTSADLLYSGASYNIVFFGGSSPSVLELQFSGVDAVTLAAGHRYVFEIEPMIGQYIGQSTWYRSSSDVYVDGAAYSQWNILGGTPGFDMSLAVTLTPVPEPSSFTLMGLGALLAGRAFHRKCHCCPK
jgi:hypothetical protein